MSEKAKPFYKRYILCFPTFISQINWSNKTQQFYLQHNVNWTKAHTKICLKRMKKEKCTSLAKGALQCFTCTPKSSQLKRNFQQHSHNHLIDIIKNKTPNWSHDWKFKVFFINIKYHTSPCLEVFIQEVWNWKC